MQYDCNFFSKTKLDTSSLTQSRVPSRVESHSEGLMPGVALQGNITWVNVEQNTTKTEFREYG